MTTDWLIALTVEGDPSWFIITLDTGEEWRARREAEPPRVLSMDEARAWLARRPDAVATS